MENIKNKWSYIRSFRMNSLFWRTFLIISLLFILPFITLGIIFYTSTYSSVKHEVVYENNTSLESTKNIIDSILGECDMMSSYIASSTNAKNYMLSSAYSDSLTDLITFSKTIPLIYKYIDSVYIYSEDTNSVFAGTMQLQADEMSDSTWIDGYSKANTVRGIIVPRVKNNSYPPLITFIKPIYAADEKKGAVIMNINSITLYNSVVSVHYENGREFFLADNSGSIILTGDADIFSETVRELGIMPDTKNEYNSVRYKDSNYMILSETDDNFGFTYIGAYPLAPYENRLSHLIRQIIFIALGLLALCFVIAYIASVKSYTPLSEIISFLDDSAPGVTAESENELNYIINSIKAHIDDKSKMEEILEQRMKMLKNAQYEMLQAQINPHFLYNTLETINWMAYDLTGTENTVSESLVDLAGFFRNTLSASGYLITIENEIKYTNDYVKILKLRYSDLFDIEWDIDRSLYPCSIIKICLQPIIENAVYHGFKPKKGKGTLKITGMRAGDSICICLSDNGIGMDTDTLDDLNRQLQDDIYADSSSHIGLANVNKRIKIIFGNEYGLRAESQKNVGTSIYVTIPASENQS